MKRLVYLSIYMQNHMNMDIFMYRQAHAKEKIIICL
jgi:hypothetical protein